MVEACAERHPAERIRAAFAEVRRHHEAEGVGAVEARRKADGSPVTDADLLFNRLLFEACCGEGDVWLSEEAPLPAGDAGGGGCVWVVDPIDGTKEYVAGVAEWAVSVAAIRDGRFCAAGVYAPAAGLEMVWREGEALAVAGAAVPVAGVEVLVSRSESKRGLWRGFGAGGRFAPVICGSIAYKLALVAGGRYAGTATVRPKNAWDIAAGLALLEAGGGVACDLEGVEVTAGALGRGCRVGGLVAVGRGGGSGLLEELRGAVVVLGGG